MPKNISQLPGLYRIERKDIKPTVEMLSRAFLNYPMVTYYFPKEEDRRAVLPAYIATSVYTFFRYGEVYATSERLEGAALWISSDDYHLPFWRLLRAVPLSVWIELERSGGPKLRQADQYLDAVHRRVVNFKHWYLLILGVDPPFQGKGYGGQLLRSMFTRLDKEGIPCYLETADEKDVNLYKHLGFKIIDESLIPGTTVHNWAMLRRG